MACKRKCGGMRMGARKRRGGYAQRMGARKRRGGFNPLKIVNMIPGPIKNALEKEAEKLGKQLLGQVIKTGKKKVQKRLRRK